MVADEFICPLSKGETILVALDGSANSERALEQALDMGRICNSTIYGLSVTDMPPRTVEIPPDIRELMAEETKKILSKAVERAKAEGLALQPIMHTDGLPQDHIVAEAKARGVDLIVIGTHGRSGLKKLFMGSVGQSVIAGAPCPVLVVPG